MIGRASSPSLTLPNAPVLVGLSFYVQALVLHTANPADARFTNVLAERVVK